MLAIRPDSRTILNIRSSPPRSPKADFLPLGR
jgi:hypothetical protein